MQMLDETANGEYKSCTFSWAPSLYTKCVTFSELTAQLCVTSHTHTGCHSWGPRGAWDQLTLPGEEEEREKMEGNRDEAEKCINIATKALEAGDKEKALKFLNKAEKLYPTGRAKGSVVWAVLSV